MKIALCQLNPLVGDIGGNVQRIEGILENHREKRCDLFIFPELVLQGYPPRDLLEKQWFVDGSSAALDRLLSVSCSYPDAGILFGTISPSGIRHGKKLYNSAYLICNGRVLHTQAKSLLPTYDIFDETRYFEPADSLSTIPFKNETLGISVCEDAWNDPERWPERLYDHDPVGELAHRGATLLINISASPFHIGKEHLRHTVMRSHSLKHRLPLVFVNQIGGNDELIFDGNSMFFDSNGDLRLQSSAFKEEVGVIDTSDLPEPQEPRNHDQIGSVGDALALGLRDYAAKCGFKQVLLGLSGGIDSAVTATIAAKALAPSNVWGVTMPSRYSSPGSVDDSEELARRLKIRFSCIPIEPTFASFLTALSPHFQGTTPDITEENLQARIRGTILMALSNKFNSLLLSTGNKSEFAVGYSTLYGDMNGGLSVISDLPKGMVYELADHLNRNKEIIPSSIIKKAPSAELRNDQKDEDSLPPYPVLDTILEQLVEHGKSQKEIVGQGYDQETVAWVAGAIARNEYKRRQAPTGLKVTPKSFGSGRRFPIAARYSWK